MSRSYESAYDEGFGDAMAKTRDGLDNLWRDVHRLNYLLSLYDGCKWTDSGPLEDLRPEDTKYINRADLIAALDKAIQDKT